MLTREEFVKHLREALNHLCDPDRLRHSPLADLFGVANRFDTFAALQGILTQAIEFLEPDHGESPQARAWRIYECLYYRYVQQFSPQEVAEQLGIGLRHLRREQHAAVDVLADQLWRQYQLGSQVQENPMEDAPVRDLKGTPSPTAALNEESETTSASMPSVNEELAWLKNVPPDSSTSLMEALPTVLELVQPLAARRSVQLDTETPHNLPNLVAHPVAVNQILLNMLSVALHYAPSGQIRLSVQSRDAEVAIQVQSIGSDLDMPTVTEEDQASLDMARQLAELSGGGLVLSHQGHILDMTLILPAMEPIAVLVIDDNADTLHLLARYTAGTRYNLVTTRDPDQAIGLANTHAPQVIVLDVMMPQVDGWKVLGRLCHHPLTTHIPILVCTILAQEELALSLGASGFVRKPVTRQCFLAALNQVARVEPEPR